MYTCLIVPVFLLHGSLFILQDYCYMDIPVFSLHNCFSLLILIFLLLDMCAVDMRCVKLSTTWF